MGASPIGEIQTIAENPCSLRPFARWRRCIVGGVSAGQEYGNRTRVDLFDVKASCLVDDNYLEVVFVFFLVLRAS